jgi:hypothetical protein
MKAIVGDGIRYLCERVEKPSEKLSALASSADAGGRVEYRHTRRSRAQQAGKQPDEVPGYSQSSSRLPMARARPVSLPALVPDTSGQWGQESVQLARRSDEGLPRIGGKTKQAGRQTRGVSRGSWRKHRPSGPQRRSAFPRRVP